MTATPLPGQGPFVPPIVVNARPDGCKQSAPMTYTAKVSVLLSGGSNWTVLGHVGLDGDRFVLTETVMSADGSPMHSISFTEIRVSSTHMGPVESRTLTFPTVIVPCPWSGH